MPIRHSCSVLEQQAPSCHVVGSNTCCKLALSVIVYLVTPKIESKGQGDQGTLATHFNPRTILHHGEHPQDAVLRALGWHVGLAGCAEAHRAFPRPFLDEAARKNVCETATSFGATKRPVIQHGARRLKPPRRCAACLRRGQWCGRNHRPAPPPEPMHRMLINMT